MTLGNITFVFLLTVPILTMRLLSEERNKRRPVAVDQPLSCRDRAGQVFRRCDGVLISCWSPRCTLWPCPCTDPLRDGDSQRYLGFFLMGRHSSPWDSSYHPTTENQLIAAIITFVALLNYLLDGIMQIVPTSTAAGIICGAGRHRAGGVVLLRHAQYLYRPDTAAGEITTALAAILNASLFDGLIVKVLSWISPAGSVR